jgi:hypothetical protein
MFYFSCIDAVGRSSDRWVNENYSDPKKEKDCKAANRLSRSSLHLRKLLIVQKQGQESAEAACKFSCPACGAGGPVE